MAATAGTELQPEAGPGAVPEERASTTSRTVAGASRLAAFLAAGSLPLHVWMLTAHAHAHELILTTLMAAISLLHVALFTVFPAIGAHGHHGATAAVGPDAGHSSGAGLMLTVVALELEVCLACAGALRPRHGAKRITAVPTLFT